MNAVNEPVGARLAPDAAERDAEKRKLVDNGDGIERGEDIVFITKHVSDTERAAVISVLTKAREEETNRVRKVSRRERDPWSRPQRAPEGFDERYGG